MRPSEVEQWVVRVLDRLERGVPLEDDRVELKRQLPDDHPKAARRIAGHANQAREDRILWIIGVDEKADEPLVGAAPGEVDAADWWAQVEACFDDVAPSPVWVHMDVNRRSVLGLGFETDRPPYVVRRSGDGPNREVPWRDGTRVRSANRYDLLKVLVPTLARPRIRALEPGTATVSLDYSDYKPEPRKDDPDRQRWAFNINLYLETAGLLIVPDHLCEAVLEIPGRKPYPLENFTLGLPATHHFAGPGERRPPPAGRLAARGDGQFVAEGPSVVVVSGYFDEPRNKRREEGLDGSSGVVRIACESVGNNAHRFGITLTAIPAEREHARTVARWTLVEQ